MEEIIPTEKEKQKDMETAKKIIKEINNLGHKATLVGSIAKDTYLKGSKDIDIFIMFPEKTPRKKLEEKGLEIAKKVCEKFNSKPQVKYAEHPYTRTTIDGYDIDIVPCYCIRKGQKIISAVDRSPLHTEYVKKHLDKPNEVRKLKHFMKQIGVYSAKISVRGFSGYLCELLIIEYGSFDEVLKAASEWTYGTHIDLEDHGTQEFEDPLIVIDPVDTERNVAAALTEENYAWFILASRYYLKHSHIPRKTKIYSKRGKFYVLEWKIKEEIEEIIWSQLERFQEKLIKQLEMREFSVIDSIVWTDSESTAQILLELEVWELPPVNDHQGPEVYDSLATERFIEKYGKAIVKGNRVYTEKKREYRKAKDLLKAMIKESPSHLSTKCKIHEGAKDTRAYKEYEKRYWKLS